MLRIDGVDIFALLYTMGALFLPFFLVGLGIFAGYRIRTRWFYPITGVFLTVVIFELIAWITLGSGIPFYEKQWLILEIMLCISLFSMLITSVIKLKAKVWVRMLIISIIVVCIIFPIGIIMNKIYCPTYYKYPDIIINSMTYRMVEKIYGKFDIQVYEKGICAYYAYTDEQGNRWYYTMYHDDFDGDIKKISMEILNPEDH